MEQPETGGCENHYDNDHLGYCPQGWRRHANPPAGIHSMLAYQGNDYYEKHCDGQKNAYFQQGPLTFGFWPRGQFKSWEEASFELERLGVQYAIFVAMVPAGHWAVKGVPSSIPTVPD